MNNATHFLVLYAVPCYNPSTKARRIDKCSSGVREIKYLFPFLKSVGDEAVAVFRIKQKKG